MCLQVEAAPGRVCAEDETQLWAEAPGVTCWSQVCVMSVYQDIANVFFCSCVAVVCAIIGVQSIF